MNIRPRLLLDRKVIRKELRAIGRELVRDAKALLGKGARGSPSKPAQAPHSQTGSLRRSIQFKPSKGGLRGVLKARALHAKFLETGAQGGGRKGVRNSKRSSRTRQTARLLDPRPFISTVVRKHAPMIQRRLQAVVKCALVLKAHK